MRGRNAVLAAALIMAPLGAESADLVVWWEEGVYDQEEQAVKETIAAFEQKTGKQVELVLGPQEKLLGDLVAALDAGRHTPDFIFTVIDIPHYERWAYESRLVELTDAIGHYSGLFEREVLDSVTVVDAKTGRRGLYMLPMGWVSHHVHVWKSLLERAGFTLADIPKEWDAFWSFWCDEVQPAVRKALGRDDIWGVGLPMSATSVDTANGFWQFVSAYEANYVTHDGRLVIDDPEVRRRLIEVIESYTAVYRKGCTPPDSVRWDGYGNNKEFLEQTIVMTLNQTLSVTNALKASRPEDYYENAVTVDWPDGAYGQPLVIETFVNRAAVFKDGGHIDDAKKFVRFLVGEGWLAHYLDFAGERMLPPMPKLLQAPFWLDPSDPHRMRSAMQLLTQPRSYNYAVVSGDWRHSEAYYAWPGAIHRVAAGELTPEQAVDEAIARVKLIGFTNFLDTAQIKALQTKIDELSRARDQAQARIAFLEAPPDTGAPAAPSAPAFDDTAGVQDRAKNLERIARELEGTLFNITHEGSARIIAEHERRIAEIEALRARDGSNAEAVGQLIAQSAAVRDAQLSQLRAKEVEAAEKVRAANGRVVASLEAERAALTQRREPTCRVCRGRCCRSGTRQDQHARRRSRPGPLSG